MHYTRHYTGQSYVRLVLVLQHMRASHVQYTRHDTRHHAKYYTRHYTGHTYLQHIPVLQHVREAMYTAPHQALHTATHRD